MKISSRITTFVANERNAVVWALREAGWRPSGARAHLTVTEGDLQIWEKPSRLDAVVELGIHAPTNAVVTSATLQSESLAARLGVGPPVRSLVYGCCGTLDPKAIGIGEVVIVQGATYTGWGDVVPTELWTGVGRRGPKRRWWHERVRLNDKRRLDMPQTEQTFGAYEQTCAHHRPRVHALVTDRVYKLATPTRASIEAEQSAVEEAAAGKEYSVHLLPALAANGTSSIVEMESYGVGLARHRPLNGVTVARVITDGGADKARVPRPIGPVPWLLAPELQPSKPADASQAFHLFAGRDVVRDFLAHPPLFPVWHVVISTAMTSPPEAMRDFGRSARTLRRSALTDTWAGRPAVLSEQGAVEFRFEADEVDDVLGAEGINTTDGQRHLLIALLQLQGQWTHDGWKWTLLDANGTNGADDPGLTLARALQVLPSALDLDVEHPRDRGVDWATVARRLMERAQCRVTNAALGLALPWTAGSLAAIWEGVAEFLAGANELDDRQ